MTRFYSFEHVGGRWQECGGNPLAGLPVAVSKELPVGFAQGRHRNRLVAAARHWDDAEQWTGDEELFGLRVGERDGVGVCVTLTRRLWQQDYPLKRWIEVQAAGPLDVAVVGEFGGW